MVKENERGREEDSLIKQQGEQNISAEEKTENGKAHVAKIRFRFLQQSDLTTEVCDDYSEVAGVVQEWKKQNPIFQLPHIEDKKRWVKGLLSCAAAGLWYFFMTRDVLIYLTGGLAESLIWLLLSIIALIFSETQFEELFGQEKSFLRHIPMIWPIGIAGGGAAAFLAVADPTLMNVGLAMLILLFGIVIHRLPIAYGPTVNEFIGFQIYERLRKKQERLRRMRDESLTLHDAKYQYFKDLHNKYDLPFDREDLPLRTVALLELYNDEGLEDIEYLANSGDGLPTQKVPELTVTPSTNKQ